ncbi:RE2 [Symbiodinium microadriaticum]|nr:RE2 [Symbiodinium microadriaticum]
MAQAVAHRRSGRHFFMELFRGAAPHRTVEGQELMDEPGVFDFLERPAVANAFRSSAADGLVGAVLEAMQKRLRTTTGRSVCEEKRPSKARRPASLPGPREPGEQIALDIFDVFDAAGTRFSILHAVDGATKFQMAVLVVNKSSAEVVKFLRERWAPVFGMPRTIVCDQGREIISIELEDFASQNNIFLYHIAVQAPWQNGLCEKVGGILKGLISACASAQSLMGADEMTLGLGEAVQAYNMDVGDSGFSPMQAAVGRQPLPPGDALAEGHMGELDAMEEPSFARLVAVRETARMARRLLLRKWHGPGLLVAFEGNNCYITSRGTLTTGACAPGLPYGADCTGEWEAVLKEVVEAAKRDQDWELVTTNDGNAGRLEAEGQDDDAGEGQSAVFREGAGISSEPPAVSASPGRSFLDESVRQSFRDQLQEAMHRAREHRGQDLPLVSPDEMVRATASSVGSASRRPSTLLGPVASGASSRAPGTHVTGLLRKPPEADEEHSSLAPFPEEIEDPTGTKRPAEVETEDLRQQSDPVPVDALALEKSLVLEAAQAKEGDVHPLVRLQAQVAVDLVEGENLEAKDHGTWDGRWPLPSRSEYESFVRAGLRWPARKEYHWRSMNAEQRELFREAAREAWNVWVRNDAVETLTEEETAKVLATLKQRGEMHKILTPRYVFTDKNDGLRTSSNNLPIKASARTPQLPRGRPNTLLFSLGSSYFKKGWRTGTADVKSAFLKGERYIDGVRELSLRNVETKDGSPALPTGGRLSKIVKGVFGFSDAPREWYLRLKKSLKREKWSQSAMDAATFFLWSGGERPELLGMMCCHVDDLLFSGSEEAWASVGRLGEELGFGSVEKNDFVYCGKRVAQDLNTGVISVSMEAYVDNLVPIHVAASRRRDMDSALNPGETRQLRGLVGSLQWLVAQVRADMGYHLSVLQAESPTVATMLKANLLVTEFKATKNFMLKFRPMNLEGAGIVVVSDASLGNVTRAGAVGEKSTFAAELLGVEEGFDIGQYCRGHWAEALGYDLAHKSVDCILDTVALVVVTDAKDTFDKGNSDTPSYGSQKSLAFSIAWLRGMLSRPNVSLCWTETSNMFVDAGTKDMCGDHMRNTLTSGEWSFRYNAKFVKQTIKAKFKVTAGPEVVSGSAVRRGVWRILERDEPYSRNLRPLDREAAVLITVFKTSKEEKINEKASTVSGATDARSEVLRSEDLKRLLAEVYDSKDTRWVLQRLQEQPVQNNTMVAFKTLVAGCSWELAAFYRVCRACFET